MEQKLETSISINGMKSLSSVGFNLFQFICVVGKIHFQVKQGVNTTPFLLFLSRFHLRYTEIIIKNKFKSIKDVFV